MAEKKPRDNFRIVVTTLCIVIAVSFTAIVYSIQVIDLENQVNDLQVARLVNIRLGYSDNGQGIIPVSGYAYNPGTTTAYGAAFKWTSTKTEQSPIRPHSSSATTLQIPQLGAYVSSETSVYVDANVTYTGAPPTNVTLTLGWIEPWQIPVP